MEHSAILSTCIELPFVIKIIVLSIFEWPFYTGFTVYAPTVFASISLRCQSISSLFSVLEQAGSAIQNYSNSVQDILLFTMKRFIHDRITKHMFTLNLLVSADHSKICKLFGPG